MREDSEGERERETDRPGPASRIFYGGYLFPLVLCWFVHVQGRTPLFLHASGDKAAGLHWLKRSFFIHSPLFTWPVLFACGPRCMAALCLCAPRIFPAYAEGIYEGIGVRFADRQKGEVGDADGGKRNQQNGIKWTELPWIGFGSRTRWSRTIPMNNAECTPQTASFCLLF